MAALLGAVFAALAQVFVRKLITHRGDGGDRLLLLADRDAAVARHAAVRLGAADARARRRSWSAPACSAASARSC